MGRFLLGVLIAVVFYTVGSDDGKKKACAVSPQHRHEDIHGG